jgi:hypothetical protein
VEGRREGGLAGGSEWVGGSSLRDDSVVLMDWLAVLAGGLPD